MFREDDVVLVSHYKTIREMGITERDGFWIDTRVTLEASHTVITEICFSQIL